MLFKIPDKDICVCVCVWLEIENYFKKGDKVKDIQTTERKNKHENDDGPTHKLYS